MKSNLKEQVAEHQKDLNELFKRFESLQDTINNHLVTRLQKMDKELVELKNKIKPEIVVEPEDDTPQQCGLCKWVRVFQNEDKQNIGICNNPDSLQYQKEVLAEEKCNHFNQYLSGGEAK